MSDYNYDKPLRGAELSAVNNNRANLQIELLHKGLDPNLANSVPIPTTPKSTVELGIMANNIYIMQEEAKWMCKPTKTNYSNNTAQPTQRSYTGYSGKHPRLAYLGTWLVAAAPLIILFISSKL